MDIKKILDIVKGKPIKINSGSKIKKFKIDSRKVEKGDFFVPLKGSKYDGHQFIKDSVLNGAVGYFTSKDMNYPNGIFVDDTLKALTAVGIYKRKRLKVSVGITGTSGKTTTKEILKFLLSRDFKVYGTEGNYNNEIGLPLTLSNIDENSEIGVFELGASKEGDIRRLVYISNPEIRVLTSVGYGHVEGFGSIEGVIRGKGEIFEGGKISVLPDKLIKYYKNKLGSYFLFGSSEISDVRILEVSVNKSGTYGKIGIKNKIFNINVPVFSKAVFQNIAGSFAVLLSLEINPEKYVDLLREFTLPEGRGKVYDLGNLKLIDDSYNANPLSVKNAVETLSQIPSYKILVLGDMLELGDLSKKKHEDVGNEIANSDIDLILLYGSEVKYTYEILREKKEVYLFENKDNLYNKLMEYVKDKECSILVKGSRGMRMEDVIMRVLQS